MKALIGNSLISKLKPRSKEYDVRDTKLSGFIIRVNPSGKMSYVCQYKRGRRINIGQVGVLTPAQARDKALSLFANAAKGIDPTEGDSNKKNITLRDFIIKEYAPWVIEHRKVGTNTLAHIKRCFFEKFGDKPLHEISPAIIDQWRTARLKSGASLKLLIETSPPSKQQYLKQYYGAILNVILLAN